MKKTMKQKSLEFISEHKSVPRQDLVKFIVKENGSKTKSLKGYYSTNFLSWEHQGLIKRKGGVYSVTPLGKRYIKNPSIVREINLTRKLRNVCKSYDYQTARGFKLYRNVTEISKLIDTLSFDYDRMSESGRRTLERIDAVMLKANREYKYL
jgi:hypothetical protein